MNNDDLHICVLDSLNILFETDSNTDIEVKQLVLKQWGNWTLADIYNYYVIEEENHNTTFPEIKKGTFDF